MSVFVICGADDNKCKISFTFSLLFLSLLFASFGAAAVFVRIEFRLNLFTPLVVVSDKVCEFLVLLPLVVRGTTCHRKRTNKLSQLQRSLLQLFS